MHEITCWPGVNLVSILCKAGFRHRCWDNHHYFIKRCFECDICSSSSAADRASAILTITVLLFPPSAFFNSLVNTESRKGTLTRLPSCRSAKALMQLPRHRRLLLIIEPSFNRSPVAPVLSALSLHGKGKTDSFKWQAAAGQPLNTNPTTGVQ